MLLVYNKDHKNKILLKMLLVYNKDHKNKMEHVIWVAIIKVTHMVPRPFL